MGSAILIAALVVEIAFASYCLATRSPERTVRGLVRLGALAAFVVLTLASVIQWSFRWYGLAALLAIWAALGARTLLQGRGQDRARWEKFRAGPVVLRAAGTLVLLAVVLIPALVLPQYRLPEPTGPHEVATVSYTYADESRGETFVSTGEKRKVNVELWYPNDAGNADATYPLVVFSHGAFGMKGSNVSTFTDLASNGYVVCSIDHPYHALFTRGADGKMVTVDRSFLQEVMDANANLYDDATELQINQKWLKLRTADVSFVLDAILTKAKEPGADEVYRRVDGSKIGLIGHSLGGAAVAQVGRDRSDVDAVINLDGDLLGEYQDVVNGKPVLNQKVYPIPILTIYSDDLIQLFAKIPDVENVVASRHVEATAPKAYAIHLAGTDHMSLTDVPLVSPLLVSLIGNPKGLVHQEMADPYQVIQTMNAKVLEFFDASLKGKGSFTSKGTY